MLRESNQADKYELIRRMKKDEPKKNDEPKKPSTRRLGVESSKSRHALLDAAELIMREEGYAAVTSRHVADKAGLKPQLVYYYFRTMDDLFLALYRRRAEQGFAQLEKILSAPTPLHTLWKLFCEPTNGALSAEFLALANHRKIIGDEIARQAEQVRSMQAEVLARVMRERGFDTEKYPPVVIAMLLATLSQVLIRERVLGIDMGHAELTAIIERFLNQLEPAAR